MSTFDNPFDCERGLHHRGCGCGHHVSGAPHEATAWHEADAIESEQKHYEGVVASARHAVALRNHIIDFLVTRSKSFAETTKDYDPQNVPLIRIGKPELAIAAATGAPYDHSGQRPSLSRPSTFL